MTSVLLRVALRLLAAAIGVSISVLGPTASVSAAPSVPSHGYDLLNQAEVGNTPGPGTAALLDAARPDGWRADGHARDDRSQIARASARLDGYGSAPRTAGGLADAASGARLNARLTADEIAGGHAFTKHVVQQGQFPGIRTRAQFGDMIENVVNNYGDIRHLSGGRTAYWRDGVVVIRNPSAVDGGTAFVPRDGYDYFLGLG